MKKSICIPLVLLALFTIFNGSDLFAQVDRSESKSDKKLQKEAMKLLAFQKTDSLLNSRQFVFQADFGPGSDLVYVVVDSGFAEVQSGVRANLLGRITEFDLKPNEKRKNFFVSLKLRDEVQSADIFLFIGTYGDGRATVKSPILGNFSFNGEVLDFNSADITPGPLRIRY